MDSHIFPQANKVLNCKYLAIETSHGCWNLCLYFNLILILFFVLVKHSLVMGQEKVDCFESFKYEGWKCQSWLLFK